MIILFMLGILVLVGYRHILFDLWRKPKRQIPFEEFAGLDYRPTIDRYRGLRRVK